MSNHHNHPHPDCLALFEKLSEFLDNELDEDKTREIEGHMRSCTKCHVCVETLRRTVDIFRGLHYEPPSNNFSRRLQAAVRANIAP